MNLIQRKAMRKGTAYVLAIILLTLSVAVAAAFATFANLNARTGKNVTDMHRARLAAESGMAFAVTHVHMLALPYATDDGNAIANIAAALGDRLNATSNLAGSVVSYSENVVSVPRIETNDGAFEMYVVQQPGKSLTLEVHGLANGVRRATAVDLTMKSSHPKSVFNYGLASRGAIAIGGNTQIRGKNEMIEASIISSTDGPTAVMVEGGAIVDGDISSVGTARSVVLNGTVTIAGSKDPEVIAEHVHFGVEPPAYPEVDTSIFRPLATNVIDATTDTASPGLTFENVVIKAGTNPTFGSDVALNGVVFIEAPNVVNFAGKVTFNGLLATEQSQSLIDSCKVTFDAQVNSFGVESLPDLPHFEEVKKLTGTFIVAPGFDVHFAGQFSTISGTIAADKLTFSGQSMGTIKGSVIGLADYPTIVGGTVDVFIDHSDNEIPDAGFLPPKSLKADPRTYREATVTLVVGRARVR